MNCIVARAQEIMLQIFIIILFRISSKTVIMLIIIPKIYWLFSLFSTLLPYFYSYSSVLQSM